MKQQVNIRLLLALLSQVNIKSNKIEKTDKNDKEVITTNAKEPA